MAQSTVFSQVIKHIPHRQFKAIVDDYEGDKGVRYLDCWSWFGALLFGQLTGHDSIRSIERVFCHSNDRFGKLGFTPVCRSTLADANRTRPLEILEATLAILIQKSRNLYPQKHGFRFKGDLFVLDSSIINLCLSLSPWANFRKGKAAVKLHTAIDLAGELPDIVVVTPAKANDIPVAKKYARFQKGTTVIIDRGYWCSTWLSDLNKQGVYFVTRQRRNNRFKVLESRPTNRTQGYICDQIVYQIPGRGATRHKLKYKGKIRRISYRDPDTGKKLTFLTNRFDLATSTICKLSTVNESKICFVNALS